MSESPQNEVKSTVVYEVDDRPPPDKCLISALQTLFLVAPAIIVTPLVLARSVDMAIGMTQWIIFAALIASALSTLIQIRRIGPVGSGYLIFMGTSTAYLAVGIEAVMLGGMALVATMAIISAPVQLLFARYLGAFRRVITPTVSGVVIMLVVLGVLPTAGDMLQGDGEHDGTSASMAVALLTLLFTLAVAVMGNRSLRLWSPVLGLGFGMLVAIAFGITDFTRVSEAAWFGLPPLEWPGFNLEVSPAWISVWLTFAIVTLVGAVESVGDTMVAQRASYRKPRKIDYDSVRGGLYADGVGNMLSGALGTLPNTTYGIGVSSVELTGMAARRVGYYFAGVMVLLALMPKLSMLMISLPSPVFGAFLLVLLALLFVAGIRLCATNGFDYQNSLIIGVAFTVGFIFQNDMFFPDLIPKAMNSFFGNGIATGGTMAVLMSLFFNLRPRPLKRRQFPAKAEQLDALHQFARDFARTTALSEQQLFKLEVVLEEVFIHLVAQAEPGQQIQLRLERDDGRIHIEMVDRSTARDIDTLEAIDQPWEQADQQTLQFLGLYLLNKMALDVRHMHMAGVNYISFSIPE